jgi:hypothetical protein
LAEGTDGALITAGSTCVREETSLAELGFSAACRGVATRRGDHALTVNLEGTSWARHSGNHTGLPAFSARGAVRAFSLASKLLVSAWGAFPRFVGTLEAVATGGAADTVFVRDSIGLGVVLTIRACSWLDGTVNTEVTLNTVKAFC